MNRNATLSFDRISGVTLVVTSMLAAALIAGCGKGSNGDPGLTNATNATGTVQGTAVTPALPVAPDPLNPRPAPLQPAPTPKEEPLPTAVIPISTLKPLLPETIRGFQLHKEIAHTNSRTSVGNTTYARRAFIGNNGTFVFFEIKDLHTPANVRVRANHFFQKEKVQDTDQFLSTVTDYEGFPCWERVGKVHVGSKLQVLLEDRVLVDLMGIGISMEDLRPLMRFYDLELIQEHVKEEITQQEYRARLERQAARNDNGL